MLSWFKTFTLTAALVAPVAAYAECEGSSLMDRLDADQRARLEAAAAALPYGEGLRWQAVRGNAVVNLLGTIHISDQRLEPILTAAIPDLSAAEIALFEMAPGDEDRLLQAIAADPSLTVITEGPGLPEMLDAETWAALTAAANERGIPTFMAARMQPWFLSMSLSMPPCLMQGIIDGQKGLDFQLMDLAAGYALEVAALEPWDTVLTLFGSVSQAEQIELLRMSIVDPALQDEIHVAMLDGYFAGRIGEIWELGQIAMEFLPGTAGEDDFFSETEAALLDDRSRAWIPVIEAAAAEHGSVFAAFGAAHLPGEAGVLRLLENNGWAVERLD